MKEKYGILQKKKAIIHVSNFRAVKCVTDVIKTFVKIVESIPAKPLLVGDGSEVTIICALVGELNLRDKILFLGKQSNVEELYSMSDLMLLLSQKESFGLFALEAVACGVPCIGTNIRGKPEVIIDGEMEFICELGDINTIADSAIYILTNDTIHKRFSNQSIQVANEKFRTGLIVKQYEDLYFNLIRRSE